jgi:hypothetical protein
MTMTASSFGAGIGIDFFKDVFFLCLFAKNITGQ